MHTRLSRRALNQGFTLIEILTVLAIIGILTAILIPAVSKARERTRLTATVAEIRSLKTIVAEAANRLKGSLPITEGVRRNPGVLNTSNMQVYSILSDDPTPPYSVEQYNSVTSNNLNRGITYSKLVRLDHVLTTLTSPVMDSPWSTQFGGGASLQRMVQPPFRFNQRHLLFESTAQGLTLYTLDGNNSADDSSRYSRLESATMVASTVFNIRDPLADVNTAGGICFDLDGDGAAGQVGMQCAYVIYKRVPVTQAFKLALELNAAGRMTDRAPGGIEPQTMGSVIYGTPVGGVVDVYVHLLTL